MEWSKLKTIIILILIALNLCLLILVFFREHDSTASGQTVKSDVVSILKSNGITVNTKLPEDNKALYLCTITRDKQSELKFASALLGDGTTAQDNGGSGSLTYSGPRGTAQVGTNGEFSFAFSNVPSDFNASTALSSYLTDLGFGVQKDSNPPENGTVTLSELWKNAPLLSQKAVFSYADGTLQTASGSLVLAAPVQSASSGSPLSSATLLLRFLSGILEIGDVCSSVSNITPAYQVASLTGTTTLTPVWQITTDTASYTLQTVSGDLSRQKSSS